MDLSTGAKEWAVSRQLYLKRLSLMCVLHTILWQVVEKEVEVGGSGHGERCAKVDRIHWLSCGIVLKLVLDCAPVRMQAFALLLPAYSVFQMELAVPLLSGDLLVSFTLSCLLPGVSCSDAA